MKVFDFDKVNMILTNAEGEQAILSGFANGSTIEAEYKNDAFTAHIGAKGMNDAAYAKNNDHSGTVKCTIMNTSESNKVLMDFYNSSSTFSLQIVDGNDLGKSEVSGEECVVEKPATWSRGAEIEGQEWTIGVLNLVINYS